MVTEWRAGKVRPIPGNAPHDRPVSRGYFFTLKEHLRRSLPHHSPWAVTESILRRLSMRFLRHGGIYLVRWGFKIKNKIKIKTKPWDGDHTASRWSAPHPGKRTRREDHAPSHRPQMSSGRLFLDRVARQHCPSPLHRHT